MSNLLSRVLTSVVLGSFSLSLAWLGGIPFFLLVWLIGGAILYEWVDITKEKWKASQKVFCAIFYLIFGFLLLFSFSAFWIFHVLLALAVLLAIGPIKNSGWIFFGFLYASFPVVAFCFLRGYEEAGYGVVIFLATVVCGTDIAAYFGGRMLGGRKLAPKISPNKTWSGAFCGTLAGVLGGVLVAFLFFGIYSENSFIPLLSFILSVISQIGDLGQSWFKRRFFVKDSGFLLPGHGGFMDRMDGLVSAAFCLYWVGAFLSGMDTPFRFFA